MSEAVLILPNMRGGCATVGNTVHTLFRVTSRRPRQMAPADDGLALIKTDRRDGGTDAVASPGQGLGDASFNSSREPRTGSPCA